MPAMQRNGYKTMHSRGIWTTVGKKLNLVRLNLVIFFTALTEKWRTSAAIKLQLPSRYLPALSILYRYFYCGSRVNYYKGSTSLIKGIIKGIFATSNNSNMADPSPRPQLPATPQLNNTQDIPFRDVINLHFDTFPKSSVPGKYNTSSRSDLPATSAPSK